MITEIDIEALLVGEDLADQVGEAWNAGEIDDSAAAWAWWLNLTQIMTRMVPWRGH